MFLQQVARWKSKKRRRFRLQTNIKKKFTCTQLTHEHILSERSHIDLFLTQVHQQNHIYNKYNKLDTDPMHSQASSLWYPILNYHWPHVTVYQIFTIFANYSKVLFILPKSWPWVFYSTHPDMKYQSCLQIVMATFI